MHLMTLQMKKILKKVLFRPVGPRGRSCVPIFDYIVFVSILSIMAAAFLPCLRALSSPILPFRLTDVRWHRGKTQGDSTVIYLLLSAVLNPSHLLSPLLHLHLLCRRRVVGRGLHPPECHGAHGSPRSTGASRAIRCAAQSLTHHHEHWTIAEGLPREGFAFPPEMAFSLFLGGIRFSIPKYCIAFFLLL